MIIKWIGHSCFKLTSKTGASVIIDPFDNTTGYAPIRETADVVLVSHDHFDHNYTAGIEGEYSLIKAAGEYNEKGIAISGFELFHDDECGKKRGKTLAFKLVIDGVALLHMGDVGCMPEDGFFEKIGKIDVLMIPVGGVFTIDAAQALEIAERISPNIIVPMHFYTDKVSFELKSSFEFTSLAGNEYDISRLGAPEYEINADDMKKRTRILLMDYSN